MIKYIVTTLVLAAATAILLDRQTQASYLSGYSQGFQAGVDVVRDNVNLLITRPGVKKNYKDGRGGNRAFR